jgi:signal transduction histidine kinase
VLCAYLANFAVKKFFKDTPEKSEILKVQYKTKMQIRTRLTIQFILWGGIIMIIASIAIYYSSASYRANDFYSRLNNKGKSIAKLLFDPKEVDSSRVMNIEKDNPVNLHNEKITILDYKNDTVFTSDKRGEIKFRNDQVERVRLYELIYFRQGDYEVLGTIYEARLNRFVIIAAATDIEGFQFLNELGTILIVVFFISLLVLALAGWIYSGKALKPISDVIKDVEDITITKLNLRVSEGNGTDEIGRLAKTFNNMLERLEVSFAMQKDFISNASHELRTPLTSINGQLEVLVMKDRSPEEYKAAIGSVLDDLRSLIDLANRLLLIARTTSEGSIKLNKKIRVDEIIWQAQEETRRYNKEYLINISLDSSLTDSEQMLINGDEAMLKVAVSNIIDNACKYSPDHSVDIKIEHSGKDIIIVFNDRGIGISEEELQKVFEPFYRASNAITYPGTGIGLQLVNQIIKKHNGTIKISSQLGKGTTVNMILPPVG